MKLRRFFILLFALTVSLSAYYFFDYLNQHPVQDTSPSLTTAVLIIGAILFQLVAHYLRAYKSKLLIDPIRQSETKTLFRGLSVGFLFNGLLPLRLGEFIRAFYVGDALSISKTTVLISIIFERVVDGIILGFCFVAAGSLIVNSSLVSLGYKLIAVATTLLLVIYIIKSENRFLLRLAHSMTGVFNEKIASRLRFMVWSGVYGTRLMLASKSQLLKYLVLSVGMWGLYFVSTALIVIAFISGVSQSKLWYITQTTYAAVSTPIGPGYIGTFQNIIERLLINIGIPARDDFVLLLWLVLTMPIGFIGISVLIKQRFKPAQEGPTRQALINKLHRDQDISQEMGHFLDAYLKGEKINQLLTQAELDGNFKLVRSFRGGSNAHTILAWQNKKLVVKKITLLQYAEKLEEQAKWLKDRSDLPNLPKVISEKRTPQYYSFELEYHEELAPLFEYIHSHSVKDGYEIVKKAIDFMNDKVYKHSPAHNGSENLQDYISNKIIGKINDTALIAPVINTLVGYKKIKVNNVSYDNILQVIELIKRNKQAMADLSHYNESPIHGDLTVDNIIASPRGEFLVLDPNNENQVSSAVVDLGKLYQSLHSGYEFLIQIEECLINGNDVRFEDAKSYKYAEIFNLLNSQVKKQLAAREYRSILFHEAVHYCRMLTYRANIEPKTVPVFYATAVKLFNEFLEQYEKR